MMVQGNFTRKPGQQLRLMLAAHLFWILAILALGSWWGFLVLRQAHRISELEAKIGLSPEEIASQWHTTQRMLTWESGAFVIFLLITTGFLIGLYWREHIRSRSLQAFFASVTHELRTPLTSIRLQAESIADALEGDQKSARLVARLLEDTTRLEGQVERTLELARVEGGGPLFTQPMSVNSWLERFLSWARDSYGDRLELKTDLPDLAVEADASALQVIMRNALENSMRHSRRERARIEVTGGRDPRGAWIALRDDGEGYKGDSRTLGRIFEKGAGSQGAGVGLYLIRALMERMGGTAEFASPGGFEVRLWFRTPREAGGAS